MAARCASCSYPLSVSDSVSCCECFSYFHIDCAQLVGFPYYELSSDPIRNTFHCQTCKILPLPRQSDGFSDSDSDDCAMPSRQLDYHLEGQPDFTKEMNEVKGTVQDLSELCKDLFREINELKSINLTLRCCVENLKHDGEQRDTLLSELKKRIETLEGKGVVSLFQPVTTSDMYVERVSVEKEEDVERYLTPDPELARLKEMENLEYESLLNNGDEIEEELQNITEPNLENYIPESKNKTSEKIHPLGWETSESAIDIPTFPDTEETEGLKSECVDESRHTNDDIRFANEDTISTSVSKENSENSKTGSVKDWDWRGNKAVQLKDNEDINQSSSEEEEVEASDIEDTEEQGWEILDEDVKSELYTKHLKKEASGNVRNTEDPNDEEGSAEEENEGKGITWADEVEKYDEEKGSLRSDEEVEESIQQTNNDYLTESFQEGIESRVIFQEEETEEHNEEEVEGADRTSLKEEEDIDKYKLEVDVEIVEGGAEVEGRVDSEDGSRLEGELRLEGEAPVEGGAGVEGETAEGGQSPEQGEVQPSELSEASEPPPPPQPEHTPDDLWDYLKESVSGEHPATVEEFVQKLIGTLEHVPEEYLKPVIDYNIKRATSPSVTDEEHLNANDGEHNGDGIDRGIESGKTLPQQNGELASGDGDNIASLPEGEAPVEGDGFPTESSTQKEETDNPEKSAEGYSALEGALFGGFWVAWLLYSFWDS